MARKTFVERRSEKLAEIDRIKNELARIEALAAERIGRVAIRSGLADIDLDDEVLTKEFAAIAAKFQKGPKKDQPAGPAPRSTQP